MSGPVLVIDFNNTVYRARAGYGRGEYSITYTFMLMLRKAVEMFAPSKIYVVKEGHPQRRHDIFSEYKLGRQGPGDDFWRQHGMIVSLLSKMPVHIVRHPLRECDDTIGHIVKVLHKDEHCVVYSTDTDFIQLLTYNDDRVRLWNPTRKVWIPATEYDYVRWKSLTGDGTDGIPGFKGIGGKTAEKLITNQEKLDTFLSEDDRKSRFERNLTLIAFHEINEELERIEYAPDWETVRTMFSELGFESITNNKSWNKFTNTFSCLSLA